jgi:hypothetical protein
MLTAKRNIVFTEFYILRFPSTLPQINYYSRGLASSAIVVLTKLEPYLRMIVLPLDLLLHRGDTNIDPYQPVIGAWEGEDANEPE